jgi:hypothetical protein
MLTELKCDRIKSSYRSCNEFRPEANVVFLVVELAGGCTGDVLPIKRFDFSSS